ncbi:hypothetical protein TCSYLVIO_008506, partial [Trypanosoma cruzi]
ASVVVVLGASDVVVVVVGGFVVVVVVVVVVLGAVVFFSCSSSDSFVPLFASCPADRSFGSFSSSRFVLSNCVVRVVGFVDPPVTTVTVDSFPKGAVGLETAFPPLSPAITHTDEQQHRASTNRAHSRRHFILVSVAVQWCGADLHSEGNEEQQGRREVQQTHTVGTPHEERAAARHASYAAHHARHTLQSTAAGTHTTLPQHQQTDGRGRSKQERHTRLHRMHMRRERSVVSAPLTEGTHTHEEVQRTQQHKGKVTIKGDPHTPSELLVHGKCSQYSSQKQFSCLWPSFIFSAHHFMQPWEPLQQK